MRTTGFIISMVLAMLPMCKCMADGVQFLVVNAKDRTKTTFALADKPKVMCKGGKLSIITNGSLFSMNLADVLSYDFTEDASGIGEVLKDGNVEVGDGYVVFNGLPVDSKVSFFLQNGRLVKECKVDTNGVAIINLSGLPKGIMILHSNKTDIKIINR